MRFAERALQKYPNSFDVVYESGLLYFMSMIHYRGKSPQRAIELFEKAVDVLKQNNIGGLNDAKIGLFLSQNPEKAEESLCYGR